MFKYEKCSRRSAVLCFTSILSFLLLLINADVFAGWKAPEFPVNSESILDQAFARIDANDAGRFVITWHSQGVDANRYAIAARVFNAPATPAGLEFQVNATETGDQIYPDVAVFSDGGFVITWCSTGVDGDGYGIVAQLFDTSANKIGSEITVNSSVTGAQYSPVVTSDGQDRFVIAWVSTDTDGDGEGIFGQRFDADGTPLGGEFQVNTYTTGEQSAPTISADNAGAFAVAWQSWEQDTSDYGIYYRLYDENGNPQGNDFRVNIYTPFEQSWPDLKMVPAGDFCAVWQSSQLDGSDYGVVANLFDSAGTHQLGVEFVVNSEPVDDQQYASIDSADGVTWIAVWQSRNQDSGGHGVYAQRFDTTGAAIGVEARINAFVEGDQRFPQVAALPSGAYLVVWDSQQVGSNDYDIVARYIAPCIYETDCSDGLYCNGEEFCNEGMCALGEDPCDDGLFCNGRETCEESTHVCDSPGDPCAQDETCNEETDSCDSLTDDDDDNDDNDNNDDDNDDDNDSDPAKRDTVKDNETEDDSCCCGK